MVWRMLADDSKFDTSNYHREAERHWGLLHADGSAKPAFQPFLNGMVMEKEAADRVAADAAAATQAAQERATRTSARLPRRERRGAATIGRAIPRPPAGSPARTGARRP
jgi:hypothetical protein